MFEKCERLALEKELKAKQKENKDPNLYQTANTEHLASDHMKHSIFCKNKGK